MNFQDNRVPGVWTVGCLVWTVADKHYLVIQHQADDVLLGEFSVLDISTSQTVMTRATLSVLSTDFNTSYPVSAVVPSGNVTVVIS